MYKLTKTIMSSNGELTHTDIKTFITRNGALRYAKTIDLTTEPYLSVTLSLQTLRKGEIIEDTAIKYLNKFIKNS